MAEHPTFKSSRRTLEEAAREVLTIEFWTLALSIKAPPVPEPQSSVL